MRIKVVGVGGAGGNAVTRMMERDRPRGVEFIAVNTDSQDLEYASAHRKVYIGKALTRGLGAGMNPEIGKQAAEENRSELGEMLEGADIVFITAGFGGGTGTGAAPVIAEIAREKGILTVAFVTRPFSFEGGERAKIANEGLTRIREKVDSLVVVPNDRIFSIINKDTSILRAFDYIDDVLRNGICSIADLMNAPGIVNVDFADIKSIMKDAGTTLFGVGVASGADRSVKAVEAAIHSPLSEISIDGARGVLFGIAGGRDLKMAEVHEIAKAVSANLDQNARIIFGAYHDRRLKEKNVRVTVIATGFNGFFERASSFEIPMFFTTAEKSREKSDGEAPEAAVHQESVQSDSKQEAEFREGMTEEKTDPWAIPAFLRKKKGKNKK